MRLNVLFTIKTMFSYAELLSGLPKFAMIGDSELRNQRIIAGLGHAQGTSIE